MTPAEALSRLSSDRLRFADPAQIQMLDLLALAETLIGRCRKCPDCGGRGKIKRSEEGECMNCGRKCAYCGGHRMEECGRCEGEGELSWNRKDVYALDRDRLIFEVDCASAYAQGRAA